MSWVITGSQKINWDPSLISTALWLDAADASTVTTVDDKASQWNDKSGNSRNATQATADRRPLYGSVTQNGKNTLTFTASSTQRLDIASTPLFSSGNADLSIFAAYKSKVASNSYGTLFSNLASNEFAIVFGGQIGYLIPWGVYNAAAVDLSSDSYTQNNNYIISCIRSSGSFTGWTHGNQNNTVSNTNSVYSGVNTQSAWKIGANLINGEHASMDLWELICVNSALNPTDRQKIEGYLAHKWGQTTSLPSDHPYKVIPPVP